MSTEPIIAETMPAGLNTYQPQERQIFHYFNGEKVVPADPMILFRKVMAKGPDLDADMKAASFPGFNKGDEAYIKMTETLRGIFNIKSVEEGGLSGPELEELLNKFLDYCEWLKKKWNLIPTSATETSAPTASSSDASPTIPNTSDSGSTAPASSIDVPSPSLSAMVSPQEKSAQAWSIGEM